MTPDQGLRYLPCNKPLFCRWHHICCINNSSLTTAVVLTISTVGINTAVKYTDTGCKTLLWRSLSCLLAQLAIASIWIKTSQEGPSQRWLLALNIHYIQFLVVTCDFTPVYHHQGSITHYHLPLHTLLHLMIFMYDISLACFMNMYMYNYYRRY